ncbi:hypothetical protein J6590_051915 [Homalodisca vitripennis]|nr:hypothetical protein J6590_051915 [Homalodisca vitripennis]
MYDDAISAIHYSDRPKSNMDDVHEKVKQFESKSETDLETSLTLAAEVGNALLTENHKLKEDIQKLAQENLQLTAENFKIKNEHAQVYQAKVEELNIKIEAITDRNHVLIETLDQTERQLKKELELRSNLTTRFEELDREKEETLLKYEKKIKDEISHRVIKTGLSDHTAQVSIVQIETQNDQSQSTRRVFSQSTMNKLRNILAAQDWVQVMGAADTESAFNAFSAVMKFAIDTACPLKTIKKRRNTIKRIWNSDRDTLKRIYLEALNKEIITGNPEDKRETTIRKRAYDLKLKELRKENNSDLVNKADNKPKALWKVINSERKDKVTTSLPDSISVEGEIYNTPDSIANSSKQVFFHNSRENTLS